MYVRAYARTYVRVHVRINPLWCTLGLTRTAAILIVQRQDLAIQLGGQALPAPSLEEAAQRLLAAPRAFGLDGGRAVLGRHGPGRPETRGGPWPRCAESIAGGRPIRAHEPCAR